MSYEVTATRRRPQGFEQLVGQEFVVSTLKSSLQLGRIAHAYLFSGPRGVGKTSAARILAKALNCEKGPTSEPCGECSLCREIARGNSLDVIEIDGASNTSVNDIRELKDEVLFAPSNGRYKVYIIDEVHMLSNSAFNALLKTIEEPPPYIVFVFATTEIHKVPATIRSRCQQFNFRLISIERIKEQLAQVVQEMQIEAEDEALFWISKEATGSLRDAYTLFDQISSFSEGHISLKEIQEKLGLTGIDAIGELVELLADEKGGEAVSRAEEIIAQGVSIEQFIIDLTEYFRTLLLLKSGIEREGILGYHPDRFPRKLRDTFSISQVEYAIEELLSLYRNIRYSLNQRFELELILSKLSSLKHHLSPRELMLKIREIKAELDRGPTDTANHTAETARGETVQSSPAEGDTSSRNQQDPSQELSALREQMRSAEKKSPLTENETGSTVSANPVGSVEPSDPVGPTGSSAHVGLTEATGPGATAGPTAPVDTTGPGSTAGPTAPVDTTGPESPSPREATKDQGHAQEAGKDITTGSPAKAVQDRQRPLEKGEIEAILAALKNRPSLVSALRPVVWKLNGNLLELRCDTNYSVRKLKEEVAALKPVTEKILDCPLRIEFLVQASDDDDPSEDHGDSQVDLVKKVFRGKIIEGADNEPNGSF